MECRFCPENGLHAAQMTWDLIHQCCVRVWWMGVSFYRIYMDNFTFVLVPVCAWLISLYLWGCGRVINMPIHYLDGVSGKPHDAWISICMIHYASEVEEESRLQRWRTWKPDMGGFRVDLDVVQRDPVVWTRQEFRSFWIGNQSLLRQDGLK